VFTAVLGRKGNRAVDVFWSIVISSAVFALVHLLNLFAGAGIGSVILQVGYSFLIGGMCSVVLVKTKNIWYCVILHAVYNFAGGVVPECGGGEIWDTPTIILTAVVAVLVAVYVIFMLVKIKPCEVDALLNDTIPCEYNNSGNTAEVK
jgi:membrane protease YdiL (CAAX protease family)